MKKKKYEIPVLISLSQLTKGYGQPCRNGSFASDCKDGLYASADCHTGIDVSADCKDGVSPSGKCVLGNDVT